MANLYSISQASLDASHLAIERACEMLVGNDISTGTWIQIMRNELKKEYIRQYLLGHGGLEGMLQSDWGRIGGMLRDQYRYLVTMYERAPNMTLAQLKNISSMYVNSCKEAFEKSYEISIKKMGAAEESWVLGFAKEHCIDCTDYSNQGWRPVGTFPVPGAGRTKCLTACQCTKIYRDGEGNGLELDIEDFVGA